MNIDASSVQPPEFGPARGEPASVQRDRVVLEDDSGTGQSVFIESVVRIDGRVIILGWTSALRIRVRLLQGARTWPARISRYNRADVAAALNLPPASLPGFVIVGDVGEDTDLVGLEIDMAGCGAPLNTGPLAEKDSLTLAERQAVPELMCGALRALAALPAGSHDWWQCLHTFATGRPVPDGCGAFIEGVLVSPEQGGIVYGWAMHPPGAILWLEDDGRAVAPLSGAIRSVRQDIRDTFADAPWSALETGFVVHLPFLTPDSRVTLRLVTEQGLVTLGESETTDVLPLDPHHAAKRLFAIETLPERFRQRVPVIDWPMLAPLLAHSNAVLDAITGQRTDFGTPVARPEISILVPLCPRSDLIEFQILAFARDDWFRQHGELLYVIGDERDAPHILSDIDHLHRLTGLPIGVVSAVGRRAFGSAGNLGARHARGERLLFLGCDVLPGKQGWLATLAACLAGDETTGIVGARLLFPDGGLQTGAMTITHVRALDIWTGHQPGAGLLPEADPDREFQEVPAVSGACLMIGRALFERIGGWNTGYLGDGFADSDLCRSAHRLGYRTVHQPAAQLVRLAQPAASEIRQDPFRLRVCIADAVRHQERWPDVATPRP